MKALLVARMNGLKKRKHSNNVIYQGLLWRILFQTVWRKIVQWLLLFIVLQRLWSTLIIYTLPISLSQVYLNFIKTDKALWGLGIMQLGSNAWQA